MEHRKGYRHHPAHSACGNVDVGSLTQVRQARAVIVTSNFWPERTGIGQVNTELADFLATRGISVTVVTGHPYYPEWRLYPGYGSTLFRTEQRAGTSIRRSWHFIRPNPGSLGRIVHEITLGIFALPNLVRSLGKSSVIYIVSPDLSFAFVASVLCGMMRREYHLIVQDVMPDAAAELGMISNRWVLGLSQAMAKSLYRRATSIRTLGEGMRRRIAGRTQNSHKITVVPNAVDVAELAPHPESGRPFREKFVPDGIFAVVHAGNMGQKQDLGVILDAAETLKAQNDVRFFIFGEGAVKDDFVRRRDARNLSTVSIHGFQERALLPHMLRGADAVIISQSREVVDIVVPSKLQVAMAAGAMIVAVCPPESETASIIRASRGGILVPAGNGDALGEALLQIRNGDVDTALYRENAARYAVENYDQEVLYGPIADFINASAGSRAASASYMARSE